MLKGFRTVLLNGLVLVAPVFLHYIMGVDWTKYLSPTQAVDALAVTNLVFRGITSTKIFQSGPTP